MTNKIILAGFGGQGILFAGKQIAMAGMNSGTQVTWLPSYGPEQRGGTCNCSIIISDEPIPSPYVGFPDTLVAFNVQSFDKFEPRIAKGGVLFADSFLISKKSERDDVTAYYIPATKLANDIDAPKLANVIMLGYVMAKTNIFDYEYFKNCLTGFLPASKAALAQLNAKAFDIGYNYCE